VKIVDANVLVYAVNAQSVHHRVAHGWLTESLRGGDVVGLPWVSLLAFLRLTTSSRIFPKPLETGQAIDVIDAWLGSPAAVVPEPTTRHTSILRGLLGESGSGGNLTTDAHLAALCIEHGADVVTFDRDFQRFGVKIVVPS
jgi:uncharacterized protein